MRSAAWALVLLASGALASGCEAGDRAATPPALTDDAFVLDEAERRKFRLRLERELAGAPARRERQVRANRQALDALPVFPGAVVRHERHQGQDNDDEPFGTEEFEYQLFVEREARPYARYELVTSDSWSTYRTYLLPRGAASVAVKRHYARVFRGWLHLARERMRSAAGHAIYADDYWRAGRCIWVHVGMADSTLPPARTLTVATDAAPRGDCV